MTSSGTGTAGPYPQALHALTLTLPVSRQSHGKAIRGSPAGFQEPSPRAHVSLPAHQRNHEEQRASSR
eukprot:5928104-Amphidinium_carterae.1